MTDPAPAAALWDAAALLPPAAAAVLAFLAVMVPVVLVHELGHYLAGRALGCPVDSFSLGFGPEVAGLTSRSGTRWKACLLPLGGYVRFRGDSDAAGWVRREGGDPSLLASRPGWQRALVIAAGPAANVLFGVAILAAFLLAFGAPQVRPVIASVAEGSPAAAAGLRAGDVVTSIDGIPASSFRDLSDAVISSGGRVLRIAADRPGASPVAASARPEASLRDGPFGRERRFFLGVTSSADPADASTASFGPAGALARGASEAWRMARLSLVSIADVAVGRVSPQALSGPVRIAGIARVTARDRGLLGIASLIAFISISVAVVNLLPLPVLDGGHLAAIAIEGAIGRPIPARAQEVALRIGAACLAAAAIMVTFNDVMSYIG